jgi:hypothetical protein
MPSKDSDPACNVLNIKWLQPCLSCPGLYDRRLKVRQMDVKFHSEIGTPHTMIEVMNHVEVLLKSTGRSEYFFFQDDECVTAVRSIVYLLVKSWAWFILQIDLTKH